MKWKREKEQRETPWCSCFRSGQRKNQKEKERNNGNFIFYFLLSTSLIFLRSCFDQKDTLYVMTSFHISKENFKLVRSKKKTKDFPLKKKIDNYFKMNYFNYRAFYFIFSLFLFFSFDFFSFSFFIFQFSFFYFVFPSQFRVWMRTKKQKELRKSSAFNFVKK